jgi:hypothetical protein
MNDITAIMNQKKIKDIVMLFKEARLEPVEKLNTILSYIASKLPINRRKMKIVKIKTKSGYNIFI